MESPGRIVRTTERLVLRRLTLDDAAFALELLNEPGWLRWIGDRNVRSLEDARAYLAAGPFDLYAKYGFGLYRVDLADGTPIGMCGLIRRATLEDVDLGFALLARYEGHGYATEAARATLEHARQDARLARVVAITLPDNARSVAVLEKLGMRLEKIIRLAGGSENLGLYAIALGTGQR